MEASKTGKPGTMRSGRGHGENQKKGNPKCRNRHRGKTNAQKKRPNHAKVFVLIKLMQSSNTAPRPNHGSRAGNRQENKAGKKTKRLPGRTGSHGGVAQEPAVRTAMSASAHSVSLRNWILVDENATQRCGAEQVNSWYFARSVLSGTRRYCSDAAANWNQQLAKRPKDTAGKTVTLICRWAPSANTALTPKPDVCATI